MNGPQHKFIWLDLVRGLSAVLVCASHLRAALIVDYAKLESPANVVQAIFYGITGLGHQAVMVFFVLSGFFVGGSVLRSAERFRPGAYALARLSRLWIVLIPALLLTAAVDRVIAQVDPSVLAGAYQASWNSGPASAEEYSVSWRTFLGNVFFLQTIRVPVFGTNGPLWSLANEFWYYLLFPLCAVALGWVAPRGNAGRPLRLACAVAVLAIAWLLPPAVTQAYPIWLLGLVVYVFVGRVPPTLRRMLLMVGLASFAAALWYSKSTALQAKWGVPVDLLIGLSFCVLCVALANLPSPRRLRTGFDRLSRGLSAFSYSLYLVHFPIVALIGAAFYGPARLAPDALGMLHVGGWLLVLLAAGAAFWWLFEKRTDDLRHAVARVVPRLNANANPR